MAACTAKTGRRNRGSKRHIRGGSVKSRWVDGQEVEKYAWKRFTPEVIDTKKCPARTWNRGRGGQCGNRRVPGKPLCAVHERERGHGGLVHGLVTDAIPATKLVEFLRDEARRAEKAFKIEVEAQRVARGGKSRNPKRKATWYARYRFCLLYTSPSPRDGLLSRMPSSA